MQRLLYQRFSYDTSTSPRVSIIIALKNEAHNLPALLSQISEQDYPSYEIILVNDHSTDATAEILKNFTSKKSYAKGIHLSPSENGKKQALSRGIEAATGEWIVITDGDCSINSTFWLKGLMEQSQESDVILAYSPYQLENQSLLNKLISYESFWIACQYLIAALKGRAYMAVGRNMAFKKSLFNAIGGYQNHLHMASGDDDLFIKAVTKNAKINIAIDPNTIVWTTPKRTWGAYLRQKKRHISTSSHYWLRDQISLSATHFCSLVFYLGPIFCAIISHHPAYLFGLIIYPIIHQKLLLRLMEHMRFPALKNFVLISDVSLFIFYMILAANSIIKKDTW